VTLELKDQWIWDSWYAHDGDQWHCFFLKADKALGDPQLRHFNVTQGHAVSTDLTNWTYLGTSLTPTGGDKFDGLTTWTGSVIKDDDGLWHLFYTGVTAADNGLYQRIGHATSTDLHHWSRVGDGLCLDMTGPNADLYEKEYMPGHWHDRAMRDPWVMKDPDGDGWLMYFTARAPGIAEPNAGGAIGFATSPDLKEWTLQPPVFVGGFGQLEVPQVFSVGDTWYCLFCTDADHWSSAYRATHAQSPVTGSHYLVADNPRGPWRIAPGPFFDGDLPCRRYASRILDTEEGLMIIGFEDRGRENFVGRLMDPEPVQIGQNGLLTIPSTRNAAE